MHILLRSVTIALCAVFAVSTQVSAHDPKDFDSFLLESDKLTKESCPQIVKRLDPPPSKLDGLREILIAAQVAHLALSLDCPTKYPSLPIQILHALQHPIFGDSAALTLGPVYEYGVRVKLDLDEARYWYRRAVFMQFNDREQDWSTGQLIAARINPKARGLTGEEFQTAWDAGELKSPIYEEEIAAVQKLMSGPVAGIIAASEHLYQGTNGYPRSKEAAQKILEIAVDKGAPEAQYALARGIIERRFQTLNMDRDTQWSEALKYMTRAAGQHYLPAVFELAKLCENEGGIISAHAAMALYQIAIQEGAQEAEASLHQLRSQWSPIMKDWIEEGIQDIEAGKALVCK